MNESKSIHYGLYLDQETHDALKFLKLKGINIQTLIRNYIKKEAQELKSLNLLKEVHKHD
jgi:hypothetical protein